MSESTRDQRMTPKLAPVAFVDLTVPRATEGDKSAKEGKFIKDKGRAKRRRGWARRAKRDAEPWRCWERTRHESRGRHRGALCPACPAAHHHLILAVILRPHIDARLDSGLMVQWSGNKNTEFPSMIRRLYLLSAIGVTRIKMLD